MKKICLPLAFSIFLVGLFLFHFRISADVGTPPTPGAIITPGDKTDKIEMTRENVAFIIKQQDPNSPFIDEAGTQVWKTDYAHVIADFDMTNTTSSDESMDLIFPVPYYGYYDEAQIDDWEEYFHPDSTLNPAINFQVKVNWVQQEFEYELYKMNYVAPYNKTEMNYYVLSLVFPVTFKANDVTRIKVEYDTELNFYEHSMYKYYDYLMTTGSHWKGSIGSGGVTFTFPGDLINSIFYEYNDEFSMSGSQLVWRFNDLEPTSEDYIFVRYSPELLTIWQDRPSYLENIISNKENNYLKWDYEFFNHTYYKDETGWGGPAEGNPVYLLLAHPQNAPEFSASEEGFWLVSLKDGKTPWVHYEFDAVYEVDGMRITSGAMQEMNGTVYQLVSRPKKVKLVFSDGTSKEFELEDKPCEEILVEFDTIQTSSVRIEVLDTYADYEEENTQLGIEVLNFDVGTKIKGKDSTYGITIPEEFLLVDSKTTRIDQMGLEELKSVENFTLEVVGKNKVVFHDALDLSSSEILVRLRDFSEYIDFSTIGKVTIDTEFLKVFSTDATVTMYGLPFSEKPVIYKDGKIATQDEVSNIEYNSESGTLTFDVSSFSTFEARDSNRSMETSVSGTGLTRITLPLLLLGIIFLITILGIGAVIFYRRKEIDWKSLKAKFRSIFKRGKKEKSKKEANSKTETSIGK